MALLGDEGAAADLVARCRAALGDAAVFEPVRSRLMDLGAELADCTTELRRLADTIEPDDERLALVRERRHQLVQLRRKYGETLDEVLEHREEMARRAG